MHALKIGLYVGLTFAVFFEGAVGSAQRTTKRKINLRALVDAETAFAQAAATKGTREAFLEFLADDGVVFQPGPVNGKEFWRQREPGKGLLSWHPTYVDVSAAGDLGYTTGPFEFRPLDASDKSAAFGQYFTIWKRQNDGSWKAVLDRGVSCPNMLLAPEPLKFASAFSQTDKGTNSTADRREILNAEADFAVAVVRRGLNKAALMYFANDVRVLRESSSPATGRTAGASLASRGAISMIWKPMTVEISTSGDLGYTYGEYETEIAGVPQKGIYVRLWKRQANGELKVAVDIQVPQPALK